MQRADGCSAWRSPRICYRVIQKNWNLLFLTQVKNLHPPQKLKMWFLKVTFHTKYVISYIVFFGTPGIQQITTITTTFVQAPFVLGTFVHINNISAVTGPIRIKLSTKGPGNICHGDICPGTICPGDICPYQEYPSCFRHDFDQTSKVGSCNNL